MAHRVSRAHLVGAVACAALLFAAMAPAHAQPKKNKKRAPAPKPAPAVNVKAEAANLLQPDVATAQKAATRLGQTKNAAAVDALLDALATGLNPKVAAAALTSLAAHGSAKAFDTAVHYMHNRDRRVRAAAVRAAGSIDDKRVVGLVLGALRDNHKDVRAAAIGVIHDKKIKRGIEPMIELLKKGDEATAQALADMADADLARTLGELIGVAPDGLLARTMGLILLRPTFKPETARVQVVRILGKVPGSEAVEQLTAYIEAIPEKPPRQSRREAEALIEARLTGGN